MADRRTKILILLCGIVICTATQQCHAQEVEIPFEVKKTSTAVSPALFPEIVNTPYPMPTQVKPAREVSEQSWYWRFLGMVAISAAEYNTVKQSDGRPGPRGNFR